MKEARKSDFQKQTVVISLVFIASFIILYAALGAGLILEGVGVWKRKASRRRLGGIAPAISRHGLHTLR